MAAVDSIHSKTSTEIRMKSQEAVVQLVEADIVQISFLRSTRLDLNMAHHLVAERLRLANNKKHFLVGNALNVHGLTLEAKKFLQGPEGGLKNISGAALIASNPISALIANIFIKTPSYFPTRFFSNEHDALNWIRTLRNNLDN